MAAVIFAVNVGTASKDSSETKGALGASGVPATSSSLPTEKEYKQVPVWWGKVPQDLTEERVFPMLESNITKTSYAGPDACKECHQTKHSDWSRHSHRWMNALADKESVKMAFGGGEHDFMGGKVKLFQMDGYKMRLTRGKVSRTYAVNQTIGSRFFQYYVGKLEKGEEGDDRKLFEQNHVLPVGYRIQYRELVPVVHVTETGAGDVDSMQYDPYSLYPFIPYAGSCTACHTTPPLDEWLLRYKIENLTSDSFWREIGSPRRFALDAGNILKNALGFTGTAQGHAQEPSEAAKSFVDSMQLNEPQDTAVNLGISCEACHLGSKQHVENPKILPRFFPAGPNVIFYDGEFEEVFGRTPKNNTWICGRCHKGERPTYMGGMACWNSIDFTDAMGGSCYSELSCTHCHDPHKPIGETWPLSPQQDDSLCISCHFEYESKETVERHTHHTHESAGSRCLNCHMPKITEGLEHVIRTHRIYSPTDPEMIVANEPNACNLCHLKEPVAWTIRHLDEWYGTGISNVARLARRHYPDFEKPVGLNWLKSENQFTRLVGAWTMALSKRDWALPHAIDMLDDPYLLCRQFTQRALEDAYGKDLRDFGYRFYLRPDERKEPIDAVREYLMGRTGPTVPTVPTTSDGIQDL
jgi:predicted CXXCH cytochrome family protein